MLAKVKQWTKNATKSIAYSSFKYIKETSPTTAAFAESNQDLYKDVYHSIRDRKVTLQRTRVYFDNNQYFKVGDSILKNAISDLKSGNLYNKAREDKAEMEMMGFDDFDLEDNITNTSDIEDTTSGSNDTGLIIRSAEQNSVATSNAVSNTVLTSAKYLGETQKTIANMQYAHHMETLHSLQLGFNDVNMSLSSITKFNNEVVRVHAENSKSFFENSTRLLQEQNGMIKEMLDMQREVYKSYQTKEKEESRSSRSKVSDIIDYNGAINFKSYGKNVKNNIANYGDELTGGMFSMLSDPAMLNALASNPIGDYALPYVISTILGPKTRVAFKNFDKTLSGAFSTAIARLNKAGSNDFEGGLGQFLGKIFGIRNELKTSIDTSKFERGAMQWNGEANKALIEVIPGHLRKIESLLSGQPERLFDMKSGKWTTMKKTKENFKSELNSSVQSSMYDVVKEMANMKEALVMTKDAREEFEKNMANFAKSIYMNGGYYNPYDKESKDRLSYNVSSQNDMDMLNKMFKNVRKGTKMQMAGSVMRAREERTRQMNEYEKTGTSIYSNLYNESEPDKHLRFDSKGKVIGNKASFMGSNLLEAKDKGGKNVFDWLRAIHKELFTIKELGINGGGGKRTLKSGKFSSSAIDDKYKKLYGESNGIDIDKDRSNYLYELEYAKKEIEDAKRNGTLKAEYSQYMDEDKLAHAMAMVNARTHQRDYNDKKRDLSDNTTWVREVFDEAAANESSTEKGKTSNAKKESFLNQLVHAASIGDKWKVINEGISSLAKKPAALLTSTITKADEAIYDFFYGEESDIKDNYGHKIKGFFNVMVNKLNKSIDSMVKSFEDNIISPFLKKYHAKTVWNASKNALKSLTGIDVDQLSASAKDYLVGKNGIIRPTINATKSSFRGATHEVVNDTKSVFSEAYSGAKNLLGIGSHAFGVKNIGQTGLNVLSEGEAVIPSWLNPWNPNKNSSNPIEDTANENQVLQLLKSKGSIKNIDSFAKGTKNYKNKVRNKIKNKVRNKIKNNPISLGKDLDGLFDNIKLGIAQLFGTDQEKVGLEIKQVNKKVKESIPDAVGKGLVGGTAGLLIGGPLVGAILGASLSVVNGSEGIKDLLFGKKTLNKDTQEVTRNGGIVSKDVTDMVTRYLPSMKKYGIAGAVAGLVSPLGLVGGLAAGATIGYVKENETVRKALFGDQDGLINGKSKSYIKKFFPHLAVGTVGALALGPFGVLGSAVLGTASGLVTCSDEFKDAMLGPMDPRTKKRKGGVVGEIHTALIKPIQDSAKNMQERFFKYMRQDIFNPVKKGLMPMGKLLQIGMEKTFNGIGSTVKHLFTSKLGIPFFKRMEEMFAPIGWLGKVVNPTVKAIGKTVSAPFKVFGKMGDYTTRKLIEQGRADYMSSNDRLNFMNNYKKGKHSNYKLREFDEALARTSGENLKGVYGQLNRLKQGRGALDESEQKYVKQLGSTISKYVKGTDLRRALEAAHSGDMNTVDSILDHYLPAEHKQEIMEEINNQSAELRDIRARKEQYTGSESGAMKDINKTLGTKVNINNIDKYLSNIKTQIGETEQKEAKHPEAKVVSSIDTGMQALKQRLDTTNQLLSNILNGQSHLPKNAQDKLNKYNNTAIANEKRIGGTTNKNAESLNNDLRYRGYNKDTLNKISKFHFVDNKEHYEKIKELANHSFIIPNLDIALSYNDKIFNRIVELAQAGYQITDYDKSMKYIQDDIQYEKILSLAKAGIRLSNLDIIAKAKPENIQTAIALSELGYIDLDFLLGSDTQNNEWRYIDTNSPEAKSRFELQKSKTFKENYNKEGNSGLEKTNESFVPYKQSRLSKMGNFAKGKAGNVKRHIGYDMNMTRFKVNEAQGIKGKTKAFTKGNLDPLSSLLANGIGAGVSKVNAKDEDKTYINTEYGVESLSKTQDGSLRPDTSKDNKEILDKISDRDNTQKGILSSLKELGASGLIKGKKLAGKAKEKSGGLLGALKDLVGFVPALFKNLFSSIGGLFGLPLKLLGLGGIGSKLAGWLGGKAKALGGKALNWAGGKIGNLIGKTKIGQKVLGSKIGRKASGFLGGLFGGGGAGVDANGNSVSNPDDAAEATNVSRDTLSTYLQRIIDLISNGSRASLVGNDGLPIPGSGKTTTEPSKPGKAGKTSKGAKLAGFMKFGRVAGAAGIGIAGVTTVLSNMANGQETSNKTYEEIGASAVTAVADSGAASAIIGKTKDALSSIATKIAKFIPSSAKGAMEKFFGTLMKKVANPKNIAKIIEKSCIKQGFNAIETVVGGMTGGLGAVAMEAGAAVTWFMIGFSNAAEMFKLSPGATATPGMKILAGIVEAIDGLTPLGWAISSDDLLDMAVSYLGKYIGVTQADIDAANQKADSDNNQTSGSGSGFLDKAGKAIHDAGSSIYQKASNLATSAWSSLKNGASSAWNGISDFASNAWSGAKSMGSSIWNKLSGVASDVGNWVGDKYNSAKQWISNKFSGSGKYGRGSFNSQLDPANAMQFNAPGDTDYQNMADSGCGPVSAANMASALGVNLDPKQAASYALSKGYKEKDGGTKPGFFTDYLGKYGIGTKKDTSESDIKQDLSNGNPVLLMGKDAKGTSSQNPFGQYNHYVVGTGLDNNGNMIVQDPETNTPNLTYNANDVLSKTSLAMSAGTGKYGRAKYMLNKAYNYLKGKGKWGRGDNDNAQQIWDFLVNKQHFSPQAAAGIMGNLQAESGLDPTILQGGKEHSDNINVDGSTGYGIAQWTNINRQRGLSAYAASKSTNSGDLNTQLEYMMKETGDYPDLISKMNSVLTPEDAAKIWCNTFEGPQPGSLDTRQQYASQFFQNQGHGISGVGNAKSESSSSNKSNSKSKSYTGLFGKISQLTDILSNGLSFGSSGSGKYGRGKGKFGRGGYTFDGTLQNQDQLGTFIKDTHSQDIPTNATVSNGFNGVTSQSDITKVNAANTSNALSNMPTTANDSIPTDSLFDSLIDTAKSMSGKISGPLKALAASLGGTASKLLGDSNLKSIFGSNPFTNLLSGSKSTDNKTTNNSKLNGFKSTSSSSDIRKASSWAQNAIGTSYGVNGCTAFVRDYLLQSNNELGKQMQDSGNGLLRVPNLVSYAKQNGSWQDSSYAPVEGDIIVTDDSSHVIIADGQGGAWGDSSRNNYQVVHYPNAADAFPQIDGFITTGAGGTGTTLNRTSNASSTSDASGKYGRGKYGRSAFNLNSLPKSSIISNGQGKYGKSKINRTLPKSSIIHKGKGKYGRANELPNIGLGDIGSTIENRIIDPTSGSNYLSIPNSNVNGSNAISNNTIIDYTPQLNKIISLLSVIANAIGGSTQSTTTQPSNTNTGSSLLNAFSAINNGSGQGLGDMFAGKDMNSIVAAMDSIARK